MVSEEHLVPAKLPLVKLEVEQAFNCLSKQEKLYAHHLSRACWAGGKICLHQMNHDAARIFELFITLFSAKTVEQVKSAAALSDEDWLNFINYPALFFGNFGNYLSFGDSKFVPRLDKDKFKHAVLAVASNDADATLRSKLTTLLGQTLEAIYSCETNERGLAVDGKGVSGYYSAGITTDQINLVQEFCQQTGLSVLNTRLFVTSEKPLALELRLASVEPREPKTHEFKGASITVTYGDHSAILKEVVAHLQQALKHAANDHQRVMIAKYIETFTTGDIEAFKDSQRAWIKDVGPVVELNMGFVETYRDPIGVRAEYDGFVAMVNKETSKKFATLVQEAEAFLALLPWGKDLEKDRFMRPDFTALEVLGYAGNGIPAGINIPNFDDIRQTEGFKNVSMSNVLSANLAPDGEPISFIAADEQDMFQDLVSHAFEVQVGLHELLGHGSGKLLMKGADGKFNFDVDKVKLPAFTCWEAGVPKNGGNCAVTKFYGPGDTYDSKFPVFGSSFEECRAEAVGLVLCVNPTVLSIFGYPGATADAVHDISYINWLSMARAGIRALEFWTPENNQWRQAHMQARFALMRAMVNAGEGLLTIDESKLAEHQITIKLDRSKILSVGLPAIRNFLLRIMIYRATADYEAGKAMYSDITSVTEPFLRLREAVLKNKKPRKDFVQAQTTCEGDDVKLNVFPATPEGMVESFVLRFRQ
ncbi:hypothetical protein CAOG_08403 [Capsaspora owczarzaki ATCC 30864]|nr:hypothetical protein CAOG_08403 [Capsaspora owczarzaki ATCC 30864]|eukprot:XP_011269974.1 hypothetical protein CAOG_08403 [Capsaspora owczarzaki ATCC 30864]